MDLLKLSEYLTDLKHQCSRKPSTRFQVLGERCSGTNFLDTLIAQNLPLERSYAMRWKHGFPNFVAAPQNTVFVAIFRSAPDWLASMFSKPWHSSANLRNLSFSEFIRHEWTSTVDAAFHFRMHTNDSRVGQPLNADLHPITGQPFSSLLELRKAKMEALLSLPNRGARVIYTTHAKVTANPGEVLTQLSREVGLEPQSKIHVPKGHYGWSWDDRKVTPKNKNDIISKDDHAYMFHPG